MRRHPDHPVPACGPVSSLTSLAGEHKGLLARLPLLLTIAVVPFVLTACPSIESGTADAVEVGSSMGTGIYTKVAGIPFDLDVIAQGSGANVNYDSGTTWIDLVDLDKSGGACGTVGDAAQVAASKVTLQGLNPGGSYGNVSGSTGAYGGANSGKRTATVNDKLKNRYRFTVNDAVANAKVRYRGKGDYKYNCWIGIWWTVNGCSVSHDVTRCSSDSFTIRPAKFNITSTPTSAQTQIAGDAFTIKATAVNFSGSPTAGYTNTPTGYTGTPDVKTNLLSDWTPSGAIPAGSWSGSFSGVSGGVATGSFKYSDFGPLTISAGAVVDDTFTNKSGDKSKGDCIVGSSSNTPVASGVNKGKYGCNIANQDSPSTPRFIPHHYEVNHVITPACGSGGFTYLGQDFDALTLTVKAKNADGDNMTRLTHSAPNKPTFTVAQKNSGAGMGTSLNTTISYGNGSASLPVKLSALKWPDSAPGGMYSSTFNETVRPATPVLYDNFTLVTTVTDSDKRQIAKCNAVTLSPPPLHNATTSSCTSDPIKLRYGTLELSDGLGAAGMPAPVRVRAMYWDGTKFALNTADSCTTVQNTIATSNLAGSGLTALEPKNASSMLSAGVGALLIGSQGGLTGSAPIALKLGSGYNDCVAATTTYSGSGSTPNTLSGYLGGISCGAGVYNKDPSATITFGTLRTPYIYRSEKY